MKKAKTLESNIRVYTCKMCGKEVSESLNKWRRKPTKYKRVCIDCMPKAPNRERDYGSYQPYNQFMPFKRYQ